MDSGWTLGYVTVSTDGQDPTALTHALVALGVPADPVFTDKGMTGTRRNCAGLNSVLAACRPGDTLVVTELDRLARSLRDATDIAEELTRREVQLNIGGAVYDPTDPAQERHLVALHHAGDHSIAELVKLFKVRGRRSTGLSTETRPRSLLSWHSPALPSS